MDNVSPGWVKGFARLIPQRRRELLFLAVGLAVGIAIRLYVAPSTLSDSAATLLGAAGGAAITVLGAWWLSALKDRDLKSAVRAALVVTLEPFFSSVEQLPQVPNITSFSSVASTSRDLRTAGDRAKSCADRLMQMSRAFETDALTMLLHSQLVEKLHEAEVELGKAWKVSSQNEALILASTAVPSTGWTLKAVDLSAVRKSADRVNSAVAHFRKL